jgi:hypothetical protein
MPEETNAWKVDIEEGAGSPLYAALKEIRERVERTESQASVSYSYGLDHDERVNKLECALYDRERIRYDLREIIAALREEGAREGIVSEVECALQNNFLRHANDGKGSEGDGR